MGGFLIVPHSPWKTHDQIALICQDTLRQTRAGFLVHHIPAYAYRAQALHIPGWEGLVSTVLQDKITHLYLNNASTNNVSCLPGLLL